MVVRPDYKLSAFILNTRASGVSLASQAISSLDAAGMSHGRSAASPEVKAVVKTLWSSLANV